jgi:hypothetical protein
MKDAILLDAGMTVGAALRRLAQHGYWTHPNSLEARSWLEEYVANINELAASADRARTDQLGSEGGSAPATGLTFEKAVRLNARAQDGQWTAIRRQDGVTIFWYARLVRDVLGILSKVKPDTIVCVALDLHETTATPPVQIADLPGSDVELAVVLHGNDLVGVQEFTSHYVELHTRGFKDLVRAARQAKGPFAASSVDEAAGPTVRAFPFLQAPEKVAVGVGFDLEIGLSDTPVVGVTSTGELVLHVFDGATMIPVEVQVVADGFDAPEGWRRKLDVFVSEPAKARAKVALIPLPQNDTVRLTSIWVHFVVGGVACGVASRNVVVESEPGIARPPDLRGISWVGAEGPHTSITIGEASRLPDIELDIGKPDGNAARGSYRCVIRNAHGVPVPDGPLPIELGEDANTFAKSLIDQVRQWSGDNLIANLLNSVGKTVAGRLPPEFWTVLQAVAALVKHRPVTFQLNSAEPYVPWELAVVEPPIDPARPKFLAAQVAMGRWILGDRSVASPPLLSRTVQAMAVMAGMYKVESSLRPLPQAIEEAKTLAHSYVTMPAIPLECTAANFKSLLDASLSYNFNSIGGVQCVHFAGHGEVDPERPGDAAIYLSDGRPISPVFFNGSLLGKDHAPFIFLNACMVGTGGELLGGLGGFPGNCLAGGFSGLVAPLWAVNDGVAKSIALEFYREVFSAPEGRAVAEVLRELRSNYNSEKPVSSYLAYVYYGNPHLKLVWNRPNAGT